MIVIPKLLLLAVAARASIYMGFPVSEQLPNVARVDQTYEFQMADLTFKSTTYLEISYTAQNLPSWMSFDANSRTFSGKPSSNDVSDGFQITINGLDSSDNTTLSRNYTFIVSLQPGIELSSDDVMFTQIAAYGETNGDDGLVVKPGESFDIKFSDTVFQKKNGETRDIVAYYGRSSDRTSLPNWIKFNRDDLSFSGTVPYVTSSIAPSIIYGFLLIATDYSGYAGAEGIFHLVVGAHQLSTSLNETIKLNGTENSFFDETVPILLAVYLDDNLISKENISSVAGDNLPDFVTLNQNNYTLTGNFPSDSTFDNFTIVIKDVYGNQVQLPYLIDTFGSSFTVNELPDVNATKGAYFNYQLLNSFFTESNSNITVEYSDANWLLYHDSNKTFNGNVPKDFTNLDVTVRAVSEFNDDSKDFQIKGVSKSINTTSSTTSSSTSSSTSTSSATSKSSNTASSSTDSNPVQHKKSTNTKALAIGLGVGIPCFIIAIAALLLICCCMKRRKAKTNDEKDEENIVPVKMKKGDSEINGPGFGIHYKNTADSRELTAMNIRQLEGIGGASAAAAAAAKSKDDDDTKSTSSSLTHVESEVSSDYFDAPEKPIKSWRANDASDTAYGKLIGSNNGKDYRISDASMSTVNTENLFSVRLVNDNSNRNSNQSSAISDRFLSNNSVHGMKRDSSGNIQRLDSDGNIVDFNTALTRDMGRSRSTNSNLAGILEEDQDHSKDITTSTEYHTAISNGTNETYQGNNHNNNHNNQANLYNQVFTGTGAGAADDTSFNLLSKFDRSVNTSASNSDQQISSRAYDSENDNSLIDDFKATHGDDGEVRWSISQNNSTDVLKNSTDISTLKHSPLVDIFTDDELRPRNDSRNSTSSLGQKAKLVDFTRKGSLKQAEYKQAFFSGETADIVEDESD